MGNLASITAKQLSHVLITLILATAILYLPAITLAEAGNGGWVSAWISIAPGMGIIVVMWLLYKRHPNQTIAQYLPTLFGPTVGKAFGVVLFTLLWFVGMMTEHELSQFVHSVMLTETPILEIDILIYAVLAFALYCGLEGIARVNDVVYIALISLYFIFPVALIGTFHVNAFLPLLDKGWMSVLRGAYVPGSWFTETILLGMLFPNVTGKERLLPMLLRSMVWIGLLMSASMVFTIALLGASEGGRLSLPTFEIIKYIQWGEFAQHIDALFVLPWICAMIIKVSTHLYAGMLGMAQLFKVSNSHWLIVPLCITSIGLDHWLFRSDINFITFLFVGHPLVVYFIQCVLPVVMIIISWRQHRHIRGRVAI